MAETKTKTETNAGKESSVLDELKAEIAALKAELEATKTGKKKSEVSPEEQAKADELVTIKLFKDSKDYKDDVFVGCNGVGYLIRRGEAVQVPRKVAEILENSERQDVMAARLTEQMQSDFTSEAARLGV